jgi:hypothetical protein
LLVDVAGKEIWWNPGTAKGCHYFRVIINYELRLKWDFQLFQPFVKVMGGFLVHTADEGTQLMLLDNLPAFPHSGPNIDLVVVIQEFLENFLGPRSKRIIQAKNGVVNIEEYLHGPTSVPRGLSWIRDYHKR